MDMDLAEREKALGGAAPSALAAADGGPSRSTEAPSKDDVDA